MNELMKMWNHWLSAAGTYEEAVQHLSELQAKANAETSKEIQALVERGAEVNAKILAMATDLQKDITDLLISKKE